MDREEVLNPVQIQQAINPRTIYRLDIFFLFCPQSLQGIGVPHTLTWERPGLGLLIYSLPHIWIFNQIAF